MAWKYDYECARNTENEATVQKIPLEKDLYFNRKGTCMLALF